MLRTRRFSVSWQKCESAKDKAIAMATMTTRIERENVLSGTNFKFKLK